MRKQLIPLIITLIFFMGNNCFAQFGGGNGTAGNPYLISTKAHLITLANNVNNGTTTYSGVYFKMTANISMSAPGTFNPIGKVTVFTWGGVDQRFPFQGNFNGDGKIISNLTINSGIYVGLFGYISNATIENIGIDNSCSFTYPNHDLIWDTYYGGSLVAYSSNSTIKNSFSTATINIYGDGWSAGGLIGGSDGDIIDNCYARATILRNTPNVMSNEWANYYGGLIGRVINTNSYILSNCYSAPVLFPAFDINNGQRRSLIGNVGSGGSHVVNSYYLPIANTRTGEAGSPRTFAQMRLQQFAIDLNPNSQCSMQVWEWTNGDNSINNGCPVLYWQEIGTPLPSDFLDGAGTPTDPFLIRTIADMITLSDCVNGGTPFTGIYFRLENNLSFTLNPARDSSQDFDPIGNSSNRSFQGVFNGGGHKITNLTKSGTNYIGLFGNILNARIENLGIEGNFTSSNYGGALVGNASNSVINKCYSISNLTGSVNNSACRIGGLIGNVITCNINNSYSRVTISNSGSGTNRRYSGGFIGYIDNNSTISNCYTASTIANVTNDGALIGNSNSSIIINSYYLDINNMNQSYGEDTDLNTMRGQQFAIDLNDCQTQTWRWANNNNSINNGLPVLYWQGLGVDLPSCFWDGDGTEDDPFKIRYVADLIKLSDHVFNGRSFLDTYFIVENDISFTTNPARDSSQYFNPIGNSTNSFRGNFNGGGHKISNLTISSGTYVGLFGYISGATIDSLGIENFTLTSNYKVGGLIGFASGSSINKCYSLASVTLNYSSSYTWLDAGGLIANANNCTINNCYARSNVLRGTGTTNEFNGRAYFGGLIGAIENNSVLRNSYSAPQSLPSVGLGRGSLVGFKSLSSSQTPISNIYDSYFLSITSENMTYGEVKSSSEMKSGCFVVTLNNSQDPVVWFKAKRQVNLGYPVLSWQKLSDGVTPAGFEGNCLVTNDGSSTNPYQVKYVKDLIYISNMVANDTTYNENGEKKFFQMQNDISFIKYNNVSSVLVDSSSLYKPIGDFSNNKPFSGNFNGLRNAIANYSFLDTTKNNIGFFGYTNLATIQRLGISNINICAKDTVGGLVANADSTKIGGCFVYGHIKGKNNVGGLVGYGTGTTSTSVIDTSFTNTSIDALTNVGGLVGNHNGGTINNSYSNSEIYSSTNANNYVGGIIGYASSSSNINYVYSTCKIIRNGSNINFGKIKGNNLGSNTNCYSRDSVFVNYTNVSPSGFNGSQQTNTQLRSSGFVSTLNGTNSYWIHDYSPDSINDGYPILKYQPSAVKPNFSGLWPTTTASQVVIIQSGVQLKANTANFPKCAYVKIENGGELNNTTNVNVFGEYNRELYVGKWNLIGLSTYNRILSCLYNYADTAFKTFVKRFDYGTNNWQASTNPNINTVININTPFDYGEGFLVMPNYSLEQSQIIKSRIVAKGVLFNDTTLSYNFNNTSSVTNKFVSLANNYPASLDTALLINNNSSLIQGRLIYVYDADSGKWNNNLSSNVRVTSLKPSEGFFIGSASGIFNFKKSQIKDTSGAKNLIKSDLIYVQAIADSNVRESFLEFNEEADNAFDFEDGLMLFGNNYNSVEPFFTIPTPEINASATQLIKDAFSSLPYTTELDLRSQKNNEVSINFSNIPSNIHVYLLDSLLNKAQYLNEEPNYELQVNAGDNAKRLYVLFSYYKEDINDFFKPEVAQEIKIWNYNNNLNIEGRDLIRYELFDIMGNKLLVEDILDDKFKTQLDLGSGIYIVRAFSSSSSKAQKISISSK